MHISESIKRNASQAIRFSHRTQQLKKVGVSLGLSSIAIFSNLVPEVTPQLGSISFNNTAIAQTAIVLDDSDLDWYSNDLLISQAKTFSLDTIWRYAAAVQEINPIREAHNQQINQLFKGNRPTRVCYQNNVPWEAKQICDAYSTKLLNILRKHRVGDVYTPISIQLKYDKNLETKIKKAGMCQQRGTSLDNCF